MKLATINILEGVGIPMLGFQSTQPDLNNDRCEGFHLEGWKFVAAKLLFQKWQNQYHPRSLSLL